MKRQIPLLIGSESCNLMSEIDRAAVGAERREIDVLMATTNKHYVREHVWLPATLNRKVAVGRPINYFTLTTPDLFDVKVLHRAGVIERTPRGYPGLGFCERDDKTYSDIARQIKKCKISHKGSFEEMILNNPNSLPDLAFDVINLDFTWVPFPKRQSPVQGTWHAIRKTLEIQAVNKTSFDLFLTFRGNRKGTDRQSINQIADLLKRNLSSGRGVDEFKGRIGHLDPNLLLSQNYLVFLAIGLPKLLLTDALNAGFQISRFNVYSYSRTTSGKLYHMIKFVFGLEIPDPVARPLGALPEPILHYESAIPRIFTTEVVDVERTLTSDPYLRGLLQDDLDALKILA